MNLAQILKPFFLVSFFCFLFFLVFATEALAIVTLSLDPASGTYEPQKSFDIAVKLNTGGAETVGVDALMNFDPAILTLNDIVFGTLYSDNQKSLGEANTTGKFYFSSGNVSSAFSFSNTSPETLATLKFTAKAAGTSPLSFDCTDGSLVDTNVWEKGTRGGDAVDLLVCSNATGGSYQVQGAGATPPPPGATATPTPGPTATPTTGLTATPTVPVTGTVENTMILSIIGGSLFLLGLILAF